LLYENILLEERELVFFITEACNSHCIMCPMSEDSRKRAKKGLSWETWRQFQSDVALGNINLLAIENICITGGEPLLQWELVADILKYINENMPWVPTLILTNARAFSLRFIQQHFIRLFNTPHIRVAIPIHSSNPNLHDKIAMVKGAFRETSIGLNFLSTTKAEIEIRVVEHKINQNDLSHTLASLKDFGWRITCVNIIAMEMHGYAARNRNMLWIDYDLLYQASATGIMKLINSGIDVGLYNFPLCMLPRTAWGIAKNSISEYKICYNENCSVCTVKESCGGLFKSTYLLGLCHTKPIME